MYNFDKEKALVLFAFLSEIGRMYIRLPFCMDLSKKQEGSIISGNVSS